MTHYSYSFCIRDQSSSYMVDMLISQIRLSRFTNFFLILFYDCHSELGNDRVIDSIGGGVFYSSKIRIWWCTVFYFCFIFWEKLRKKNEQGRNINKSKFGYINTPKETKRKVWKKPWHRQKKDLLPLAYSGLELSKWPHKREKETCCYSMIHRIFVGVRWLFPSRQHSL